MPSRNIVKQYQENGIYHVYNRGINKQDIFLDKRDYATFLYLLKEYLSPEKTGLDPAEGPTLPKSKKKNFFERIDLLAYCLMPNHFHLLIKQKGERDISEFMRCLATNYSMYFNFRYDRIGTLFQGNYKAILVKDESYLLHLTRYIHLNPIGLDPLQGPTLKKLLEYDWNSYAEYLGLKDTEWIKPGLVLDFFEENKEKNDMVNSNTYKGFVEDYGYDSGKILGRLTLE